MQNPAPSLMTATETAKLVHVARPTLYELMKTGGFPRPIYIGEKSPRWVQSEVLTWLDARMAARSAA